MSYSAFIVEERVVKSKSLIIGMIGAMLSGIWTISGPSGAGKTTLIKNLMRQFPHAQYLRRVVTRPPRETEDKSWYEYLSKEEFEQAKAEGAILWPVEIHDHLYGVREADAERAAKDDTLFLVEFTVTSVEELVQYIHSINPKKQVHSIYLDVSDDKKLLERLAMRNESEAERRVKDRNLHDWRGNAERSAVPFKFIDASRSPEEVLREATEYFTSV